MSVVDKTTLKSYFETGDKPTQAQFVDLIDSLISNNLATAANDFIVASGSNAFVKKTLAQTADILKAYLQDSTIQTVTDGATPTVDFDSWGGRIFTWSTAQSTPAPDIQNFGKVGTLMIKKTIAGDVTVTLGGTGLKFVDMDADNDTVAATVDITLSGAANSYYEISIIDSGQTNGGSNVLLVTSLL